MIDEPDLTGSKNEKLRNAGDFATYFAKSDMKLRSASNRKEPKVI